MTKEQEKVSPKKYVMDYVLYLLSCVILGPTELSRQPLAESSSAQVNGDPVLQEAELQEQNEPE